MDCPHCKTQLFPGEKRCHFCNKRVYPIRWRNWFVILMLVLFYPVGVYLMWKHKRGVWAERTILRVCTLALAGNHLCHLDRVLISCGTWRMHGTSAMWSHSAGHGQQNSRCSPLSAPMAAPEITTRSIWTTTRKTTATSCPTPTCGRSPAGVWRPPLRFPASYPAFWTPTRTCTPIWTPRWNWMSTAGRAMTTASP